MEVIFFSMIQMPEYSSDCAERLAILLTESACQLAPLLEAT